MTETDFRMLLSQAYMDEEVEDEEVVNELSVETLIQEYHKLTCNRKEKIDNSEWIVRKDVLDRYEVQAKTDQNPTKCFLKLLYNNENYKSYFDDLEKSVRGNQANNWRVEKKGNYLCDSLHYADNIYQTLGKSMWCKSGKSDTWHNTPIDQCVVITKKGTRCRKSKCNGSDMCTQHFKLANN